jgi:predicted AAA+ superfamily ATPase
MEVRLEERIGIPELFTNRQEELAYFRSWIRDIEKKAAISTAIVGHRKVGKTALLQRLFNQLFAEKEGKVIPFLYEIKEQPLLLDEFSRLYYLSFISQLLSFKKRQWLGTTNSLEKLSNISAELKLDYVAEDLIEWQRQAEVGGGVLWTFANEAPHRFAEVSSDRFLVMIDEFQYINKYIYQSWPATPENQFTTLAGSYLGTSESKIAPMLITGSAVGMLMNLIYRQLPRRFAFYHLKKFKVQDFLELGYKLSNLYDLPATDECLLLAHRLLDGHPAHLRALFNSRYEKKDLTTPEGLYDTYLFEAGMPNDGRIRAGWEEYLDLAFHEINEVNAKKIVLFLAKHKDREWSRKEIKKRCGLHNMTDQELERKLKALVAADLISSGRTAVDYQGLGDPTFEKVFRLIYEKEIEEIDLEITKGNLLREFEEENHKLKAGLAAKTKEAHQLRGELNQKKGEIGELWIKSILRNYSHAGHYFAPGELGNNTEKVRLPRFKKIEAHSFVSHGKRIELDVLCEPAQDDEFYLAVEVKNRQAKKVSTDEVEQFAEKLEALRENKGELQLQGLFYSFNGFQADALEKLRELKIFWWDFETLERLS